MDTREARNEVLVPESMPLERIEAEITELAGHLAAGECRWLLLVAEFDERRGHEQWGSRTCAHWLSWHCALDVRSAQEKLRVAHALRDHLPERVHGGLPDAIAGAPFRDADDPRETITVAGRIRRRPGQRRTRRQ